MELSNTCFWERGKLEPTALVWWVTLKIDTIALATVPWFIRKGNLGVSFSCNLVSPV